ncbi:MAG: M20/M25/M40 family metallo-hydrolase [Acidobacteriota bacterium]|nr:MAG: M20/M25/M40 family metallo-hydrolase [Acidobacteriota bacterium]
MAECVEFLQRLIQTESLPGREKALSELVLTEMVRLGYDEVERDEVGNVIGWIRGEGQAPLVMFNTHLDHVDVGDPGRWPYPPYAGTIAEGRVWGRGAVDIKGPLAAQVHGVASVLSNGQRPLGDLCVTAVVQEEVGGLGARVLRESLKPELVVVGEPSSNQVRRGHRGRTELVVHIQGRSVHASAPHRGVNPLHSLSRFITELETVEHSSDRELGSSSVAPTLVRTDQSSANVIPGEVWLTCDWRNVPEESPEVICGRLRDLLDRSLGPEAVGAVSVAEFKRTSYTGYREDVPASHPAYILSASDRALRSFVSVVEAAIGSREEVGIWKFATDGGYFAQAGCKVIGFGPGDEGLAHTVREAIELEQLEEARCAYGALAVGWASEYLAMNSD